MFLSNICPFTELYLHFISTDLIFWVKYQFVQKLQLLVTVSIYSVLINLLNTFLAHFCWRICVEFPHNVKGSWRFQAVEKVQNKAAAKFYTDNDIVLYIILYPTQQSPSKKAESKWMNVNIILKVVCSPLWLPYPFGAHQSHDDPWHTISIFNQPH